MIRQFALSLLTLFLAFGPAAPLALATDYHVVNNGAPTGGDGSLGNPFGTITEALAGAPLGSGDKLVVGPGTYSEAFGEDMPLQLPPSVSLQGAGASQTVIDSGIELAISALASTFSANTMSIEDCAIAGRFGVAVLGLNQPTASVVVRNCDFLGTNTSVGVGLQLIGSQVFTAGADVRFAASSNRFTGYDVGMYAVMGGFEASACSIEFDVIGNTFENCGTAAIQYALSQSGTATGLRVVGLYASNQVLHCSNVGLVIAGSGDEAGGMQIDFAIARNNVRNVDGYGVQLFATAFSGGSFEFGGSAVSNAIRLCDTGLYAEHEAEEGGVLTGCLVLRNNCIEYNDRGIRLSSNETNGGLALMNYDFGGGTGGCSSSLSLPGRNTFRGNFEYDLRAGIDPRVDVPCRGNFWGTRDFAAIEDRVEHQPDDFFLGEVDYTKPLPTGIALKATPRKVDQAGGDIVTVEALNNTFVPSCGGELLRVELGGVPMDIENLALNGRTLTFEVPPMPFSGPTDLVIVNPGGQAGALLMGVLP